MLHRTRPSFTAFVNCGYQISSFSHFEKSSVILPLVVKLGNVEFTGDMSDGRHAVSDIICSRDRVHDDNETFISIAVWYIMRAIPRATMTSTPVPSRQRNISSNAVCESRMVPESLASGGKVNTGLPSFQSSSNTPALTPSS